MFQDNQSWRVNIQSLTAQTSMSRCCMAALCSMLAASDCSRTLERLSFSSRRLSRSFCICSGKIMHVAIILNTHFELQTFYEVKISL